ncbi:MAG: recombination mediator RecR [Francisellaceae bacterium]
MLSQNIQALINALKQLPGIGQKTAERMAIYLLDKHHDQAQAISVSIEQALAKIMHCHQCQLLCESELCSVCASEKRATGQLCIVESMLDMMAIEMASVFRGRYFILNGRISPLDGVTPEMLGINKLQQIVQNQNISEIILAVSPSVEGQTTAHYISDLMRRQGVVVTRLGFGVPVGSELEYLDHETLNHAFEGRRHLF